jgi:hypothetical protein
MALHAPRRIVAIGPRRSRQSHSSGEIRDKQNGAEYQNRNLQPWRQVGEPPSFRNAIVKDHPRTYHSEHSDEQARFCNASCHLPV